MATWMIDELAHAGPEHLDPEFVAGFDRKQGFPDPTEDLDILSAHGIGKTSHVVDLGAGTGRFAKAAAERFGRVTAVDVSPAMVAHLRASGLTAVQAGFMSFEAEDVDAVYTRHALHQLPDFWKTLALQRIADMLRPGGVLRVRDLIYDFPPAAAPSIFQSWFDGASDDPAVGYTAEDYAEHIRMEHSTFRWLFEPMLEHAGFTIEDVQYDGEVFGAYTCVKR